MSRLTIHTIESAPVEAQERVKVAKQNNGFLPNLIGVLAGAPTALEMYQEVGAMNARSSLSAAEREVVQITAATLNRCAFCVAGHTALSLKKKILDEAEVQALRQTTPLSDKKFNALALFTQEVMNNKGAVSDEELQTFFDSGYSEQQALEVVLGVALATLCNYSNNLAQTAINPELEQYA
ncbi:MAG: carboxymuconolactone decarboxylase family protein [Alcaligenaceae bacterium]|nr:carboxymuconolactone decarboxylase family protein [Alcaligenaceae bacterium]